MTLEKMEIVAIKSWITESMIQNGGNKQSENNSPSRASKCAVGREWRR